MISQTKVRRLKQRLQDPDPVTVVFRKVSTGELRTMVCTLFEDSLPPTKGYAPTTNPETHCTVLDVEKNAWRCFRYDSIVEVK